MHSINHEYNCKSYTLTCDMGGITEIHSDPDEEDQRTLRYKRKKQNFASSKRINQRVNEIS